MTVSQRRLRIDGRHRAQDGSVINGLPDLVPRYALIDTADGMHRTADLAVEWHRGHPAEREVPLGS